MEKEVADLEQEVNQMIHVLQSIPNDVLNKRTRKVLGTDTKDDNELKEIVPDEALMKFLNMSDNK